MGAQHGYAMTEMQARQNFEAAMQKGMQTWNDQATARQNRLQLGIEKVKAQHDLAVRRGENAVAAQYANMAQAQMNQLAMLSASVAIANKSVGKTAAEHRSLIESTVDALQKKHQAYQQQADLAERQKSSHLSKDMVGDVDADAAAFDDFYKRQNANPLTWNLYNSNYENVGQDVRAGKTSGLQYLNLEPTYASRLHGLSPYTTAQGSAVAGEKSAEEMHDMIAGRQTDNMVKTLSEMGIKDMDEGKARKALQLAFGGNADRAEVQKLLTEANVPLLTIKHLLGASAEHYERTGEGSEYQRLRGGLLAAQANAPGQKSIESEAFRKSLEAHGIKRDMNRKAYNLFDMPNTTSLQHVIDRLRTASTTGHIDEATMGLLGSENLRSPEEIKYLREMEEKSQQGQETLANLPQQRADLAAQMYGQQAMLPVQMAGAGMAGDEQGLKDLQNLIDQQQ
jgi:hypothetical protein